MEVFVGVLLWTGWGLIAAADERAAQQSILVFIGATLGVLAAGWIYRRRTER